MNVVGGSNSTERAPNTWLFMPIFEVLSRVAHILRESTLRAFEIGRRRVLHIANVIAQWRLRLVIWDTRLRAWIAGVSVSLFAIAIAAVILRLPNIRATVDSFRSPEAILTQIGATYGTILALVLTLSLIPIQRAGEVWSSSIVRLYRRDPVTHITFVVLGIFCVANFLFAVPVTFPP